MPALFPGPGPGHTGESHDWQPQKQLYVGSEDQGRIGLCQAGAEAMAEGGASFQEILHHYYSYANIVS